ncbi:RICIN domain-containing protein [Nonomuraea sp. NPDC050310]|uniref:RICIN domain-containing protein n=1 Tax=Nonomuraea sp. NPDC050310 TaxID=3154935 RepID=UPI0033C15C1B
MPFITRSRGGVWARTLTLVLPALVLLGLTSAVPATATSTVPIVPQVTCVGDGSSGHRVKFVYAYEADNYRYDEAEPLIRAAAWVTQQNVNDSARRDGAERWIRYATTGSTGCDLDIDVRVIPNGTSNDGVGALKALGYTASDRIYIGYFESATNCGGAVTHDNIADDDSAGVTNRHNLYPSWVSLAPHCATGHEMTHELAHALGGVMPNAPNYVAVGHCSDTNEAVCQGGSTVVCPDPLAVRLMDCGKDDYFGVVPVGTYLNTRWNAAKDSKYIEHGSAVPTMTTIPPLTPQVLQAVDVEGTEIVFTYTPSTKTYGSGITHQVELARDGVTIATVPTWEQSIRVTGLPANSSAYYTFREHVTQGGVTRTTAWSPNLIVLTDPVGGTTAGTIEAGTASVFTNDVVDSTGPNQALDLYSFSGADNAPIVQWPQNSVRNQRWRIADAGGAFTISSVHSRKCLSTLGGSGTSGTAIVQLPCTGAPSQKWTFPLITGVTYQIKAGVGTNQCIQSSGGGTSGGTPLVLAPCNTSTPSQRWTNHQIG